MTFASLCFLSFERWEHLYRAIETAVEFAGESVEVIVHDDGSGEGVRETLLTMLDEGWISHLILNPAGHNEGQGVALNRMFHMAAGDPIIKIDQDLLFHEGWLRRVREILRDEQVGTLGLFKYEHPPVVWQEMKLGDGALGGYHYCRDFVGSAMVIPRCAWEVMGPFQERSRAFAEDADWKRNIDLHPQFHNALPDIDLATNVGFGMGADRSTIVIPGEHGQPTVRGIHLQPKLVSHE